MIKRLLILIPVLILSCQKNVDYYNLPTLSDNNCIQAVVEISAGNSKKFEFDRTSNSFLVDKEDGKERIINFLPYPGNYGFIPSTLSDPTKGGDGDAIDVLIIAEGVSTGTVIEIIPIAVLKLTDDGKEDHKIIAIPVNKKLQIIDIKTFKEMTANYPNIINIIELWFMNYNKKDKASINGWGDENEALLIINKNKLK